MDENINQQPGPNEVEYRMQDIALLCKQTYSHEVPGAGKFIKRGCWGVANRVTWRHVV